MPMRTLFKHVHSSVCLDNGIERNDKVYNLFIKRFVNTLCSCLTNIGELRENHSVELYINNIKKINT